jgi:hypothetical protein
MEIVCYFTQDKATANTTASQWLPQRKNLSKSRTLASWVTGLEAAWLLFAEDADSFYLKNPHSSQDPKDGIWS